MIAVSRIRRSTSAGRRPADVWSRAALGQPSRAERVIRIGVAPAVAAAVVGERTPSVRLTDAALAVFVAFAGSAALTMRNARWAPLLPLVRRAWIAAAPALGLLCCVVLKSVAALPGVSFATIGMAAATAAVVSSVLLALIGRVPRLNPRVRTAVVGSSTSAALLDVEVRLAGLRDIEIVGHIDPLERFDRDDAGVRRLGAFEDLAAVTEAHAVDLLVVTGRCSRPDLFRRLGDSPMAGRVRVWELSGFCEEFFGHVPMSEIDASWFGYVMHPRFRERAVFAKRAMDVVLALGMVVALLPAYLALALLIRRDGGPALYRQQRIGRDGRPFTLYKLRTMVPNAGGGASQWSTPEDPRVTPLGRVLRRTHLDELPQLVNVLRGEMSLVGPRPEVPHYVDLLQRQLEFYPRRHVVKPGITGWAQVRCGYAGSDIGSAWKLCHDLYYVKHRSPGLDLMILGETVRMLFVEPHRQGSRVGPWVPQSRRAATPVAADAIASAR